MEPNTARETREEAAVARRPKDPKAKASAKTAAKVKRQSPSSVIAGEGGGEGGAGNAEFGMLNAESRATAGGSVGRASARRDSSPSDEPRAESRPADPTSSPPPSSAFSI